MIGLSLAIKALPTRLVKPVKLTRDELLRVAWAMSMADFRVVQQYLSRKRYRGEIGEES